MRIRQVALVAEELASEVIKLTSVFNLDVAFNDPGIATFGLQNALLPIGDTFLEVVSPIEDGTTAGRHLARRGDGGYMVIVQTDDLDAARKRAEDLGVRVVWEIDLDNAATIHLHPKDVGGAILSFDTMDPPESWLWAGPEWQDHVRTEAVTEIVGVEIQTSDPAATAAQWATLLESVSTDAAGGGYEVAVGASVIHFVKDTDGRGDGLSGVDLRVADRELVAACVQGYELDDGGIGICGTRFRLVD